MPYALEIISPADQEKIFQDAACDPEKQMRLRHGKNDLTKRWAVNADRSCYLMRMSALLQHEESDCPYYAFVNGSMYKINRALGKANGVYFDEEVLPDEPLLAQVKEEIKAAFAVHGRRGLGPLNDSINPVFMVKEEI